jgi:hypothetical protein
MSNGYLRRLEKSQKKMPHQRLTERGKTALPRKDVTITIGFKYHNDEIIIDPVLPQ